MESWMWDIVLFAWGFLAGVGAAFAAFLVLRMHREARLEGEQLVAALGSVDARRFLRAVTE